MMTVLEVLKAAGFVLTAIFARGALVVAVIMVLSMPLMAYAYAARAVGAWRRHHALAHARHHA